jgi:uncharacterized protein (TIGR03437 family)
VDNCSCWNGARAALLFCATAAGLSAQTLTTLASFNGTNGAAPSAALVQGTDGNLYGTTQNGGSATEGAIFRITTGGTLTTLYSFCSQSCFDGMTPYAGLIQASDGNLYGTNRDGGANNSGTVFKVTPGGAYAVLYSFCSQPLCADGEAPYAGLVQASDGNFYGTTYGGGPAGSGTVYRITAEGTLTTLYTFPATGTDGENPVAGLIQASDGNFYGTTSSSGLASPTSNFGTVFRITPAGTLTTLYKFCSRPGCTDGGQPIAGLIQATDGNFYGTTSSGGANAGGTVFKISSGGTLTTLYNFCSQSGCTDGQGFAAGLIQATDGNLYGTSGNGGANGGGTIFRITLGGTLTTLYGFCSQSPCANGQEPKAGLLQAADGNFYGTTSYGGPDNDGTVFRLVIASSPAIKQSGGVVNGASFQAGIVPGSWITIYGTNLSSATDTWANAIVNGNLPTSWDGVSVSVGGEPAYISYISPTQINAVAPNVATGMVPVTVTNASGTSSAITVAAQTAQPAFFQWGNYAVATTQDYALAVKNGTLAGVTTTPAQPGEVIILWGTGFGPTSPSAPAGVEVPSSTTYNTATTVTVTVGGKAGTVYGAALAPGFAGLYQVAIQIPASLANGDYPVVATISDAKSPSTTLITVQE